MGWFDEQIRYRRRAEQDLINDSFARIVRSITGKSKTNLLREGADISNAVSRLLGYYHIKEKEIPPTITKLQDRLDFLLSSTGILYREITLEEGWHRDAMGVMITSLADGGEAVTLLPGKWGCYEYIDPRTGKKERVTAAKEKQLNREALCFYRSLPQRSLSNADLFRFMFDCLDVWDFVKFGGAALCVTLTGLIMPKLNQILMGPVIESGSRRLLFAVMSFMLFATIGGLLFSVIKGLLLNVIGTKVNTGVRAGAMMRILSLPTAFFKNYSSGELNQYLIYLDLLCETLCNSVLSTGIVGVFSLVYITQIFRFAPSLVWPSIIIVFLTLGVSLVSVAFASQRNQKVAEILAKEQGLVYDMIKGIQKIRLSGAENRAFARWAEMFASELDLMCNTPILYRLSPVIMSGITLAGTAIMYFIAVRTQISVADYYAFNSAYAYISSAFTTLASVGMTVPLIRPGLRLIKPFLEAEPEIAENRETVSRISGEIELSHLSFRYGPEYSFVLEDLSLTIPAGQYVAIVGKSGCGKSTFVRLLLGFEEPTRGMILFDKRDSRKLDMHSVRRQIGAVMQDCRLLGGSIFENIAISEPNLTIEDAWEAAETANIAEDIREMPMGMNTVLQEGMGGISGGQRQRIFIARAIASKPKILIFDEATSALDNITQRKVADSLDKLKCTRIVAAHRLSTIRQCDRILVFDEGRILEDGTYEELIGKGGFFAELVARQQLGEQPL